MIRKNEEETRTQMQGKKDEENEEIQVKRSEYRLDLESITNTTRQETKKRRRRGDKEEGKGGYDEGRKNKNSNNRGIGKLEEKREM